MSEKYFTQQGFQELQKELEYLKNVRRKELAEKLESAISFGDITENAEFQEAKEEQAFVEGRILELEELLRSANVLKGKGAGAIVEIGSTVLVSSGSTQERFMIVGAEEADPAAGKVSVESPLGKTILHKQKGATVTVYTPKGPKNYKIVGIE